MTVLDEGGVPFDDGLSDTIIGLDDNDHPYPIGKLDAHRVSTRHLAISVFLMRGEKLLLQRRAAGKYHAPLLWANTACSHPLWGETPEACAERTLRRELGFSVPISRFAITHYEAPVGALFENETVHCFRGELDADFVPPAPDGNEVDALRWSTLDEIKADMANAPDLYTPWFGIYVRTGITERLGSSAA